MGKPRKVKLSALKNKGNKWLFVDGNGKEKEISSVVPIFGSETTPVTLNNQKLDEET